MIEMQKLPFAYAFYVDFVLLGMIHVGLAFNCNAKCNCIWRSGKQTAECANSSFERIPPGIDPGVQVLQLSRNNLTFIPANAFFGVGLVNLQRVYLDKCGVEHIDEFAFYKITNLVELDLSYNLLQHVPSAAFRYTPLLRVLLLTSNPISSISTQAFSELKNLIILDLSNCKIESISFRAFETLEKLEVLKLDSNNLETLHGRAVLPLRALHGISIDGNPWRCDCELRTFRMWLDTKNVPYISPTCSRPVRLKNKSWKEINIIEYACPPLFLNTSNATNVYEGSNVTLECRVRGDPIPSVQWIFRDRLITNYSNGFSARQTFILVDLSDRERMTRLIINSVSEENAGTYTCVAENLAGQVSKTFTVLISPRPVIGLKIVDEEKTQEVKKEFPFLPADIEDEGGGLDPNLAAMFVGIILGAIGVVVIVGVFVWWCRRERRGARKRTDIRHTLMQAAQTTKGLEEETELTILKPNPSKNVIMSSYDGAEQEKFTITGSENIVPTNVWMVKETISLDNVEWTESKPPPIMDVKLVSFSDPIAVSIGPEHQYLPESYGRGKLNVIYERELGDGSSELEGPEVGRLTTDQLPPPILDLEEFRGSWAETALDSSEGCWSEPQPSDQVEGTRMEFGFYLVLVHTGFYNLVGLQSTWSDSRRVRVWRRRGERSNPAAIVERPTVRQRGIMVWGAIAYDSRSPLLRIQGTMTAQRYVDDVLRPVTLPYLQGVPNALYQQDNARPHTARISQQALQDVQMLPWPPYSPDLSPIEHVWDIIGRRLHALPQPRSEDELWQMVEREWRAIPQDAIRTLIDSLPRRVAACIAVRGGPTCY
ncbi:kek1 [Cordylochernes scorpioides]|uniref:Kek1 n=1 Tax=Cordylochernes scorpioides TaxID=51811 RepID=A0ABY6L767_9ARAC|nr:kek1 [Cordylochernes scorpioides]